MATAERPGPGSSNRRRTWGDRAVLAWPVLLSVVLLLPLLSRSGHPLARDLVFVPRQPFTDGTWGLGDVAPRAVPLDAVVATLTHLVDGGVLGRVVLPATLVLLGWGVARLLAPLGRVAQLSGSGLAVWNAYVVERLAMGQWALVLACACLPWLVAAALRYRRDGHRSDLGAAVAWTALASLTPTGGLLALAGLLCAAAGNVRRCTALLLAGLVLQSPWLVAALTGPAGGVSDPAGVEVFAPGSGSPLGPVVALLGLGGIWDAGAEPMSTTTWFSAVVAALVLLALAAGLPVLRRTWGDDDLARWLLLAVAGAAVPVLATTPPGRAALEALVAAVPGSGLLRDSQKLMAPAVVVVACAVGAASSRLAAAVRATPPEVRWSIVVTLVLAPFLTLPDAPAVTWPTVSPVRFPAAYAEIDRALQTSPSPVVAVLPWRSYYRFSWADHGLTASEPGIRVLDADVLVDDGLQVGTTRVEGESPRASAVRAALSAGPPARTLPALGVGWVLVHTDDPSADDLDLTGLEPVVSAPTLELYRVPAARAAEAPSPRRRALVIGAHGLAALVTAAAVGLATTRRTRRGSGLRRGGPRQVTGV